VESSCTFRKAPIKAEILKFKYNPTFNVILKTFPIALSTECDLALREVEPHIVHIGAVDPIL